MNMLAYVTCPYDGRHYSKDSGLTKVSARWVATLLASFAENNQGRDPELERMLEVVPDATGGSRSAIEDFARQTEDKLVPRSIGQGGPEEPWYLLPCPNGPHFVPVSFAEAFNRGRASVVALVGPGATGKTHILGALAQRACERRVLTRSPVSLDISTFPIEPHWQQFRDLYVSPLFDEKVELQRSATNALHYTSLFMVCTNENVASVGSTGYAGNGTDTDGVEWIVVTDSWGEASTPQQIAENGWYLAVADTAVICIDGQRIVESLRRNVSDAELAVLTRPLEVPELASAATPADDREGPRLISAADEQPLHYCEVATDYLVDSAVINYRRRLGRALRPNVMVAITKADLVEAALHRAKSSLAERFSAILTDDPAKEVDPEFLWERNKLVAVLLMASEFESFVVKLLRRFPHPIFTALSATGAPPVEPGRFARVHPRGIDSIIVNHLLARHWLRDEARLHGRFGPPSEMEQMELAGSDG